MSFNARRVLEARYLRRDEQGRTAETPEQLFARVASAVAAGEALAGNPLGVARWREAFEGMLASLEFLPNSPTLMNAGVGSGQLSACFVLPVPDTMEGIFDGVKLLALVQRTGGGTGFSFSRLRPRGDLIGSTGGEAAGPVAFMKVFDSVTEHIKQGGRRRGANMGILKFMLNGALTIGTLDGTNVEIREEVGEDNFFLFGLDAAGVEPVKREGYRPAACVEASAELRAVLDALGAGRLSRGDAEVFRPVVENLLHSDPFLVLADFAAYVACQERVSEAWRDAERWTRMSIMNTARGGKFSSDRAIREYCDEIWGVAPVRIDLD